MSLNDKARQEVAKLYHALGQEYVHGDPVHKQIEAQFRLFARFITDPYAELCEAALAFLNGGEFYLPGNEEAVKRLNRFREAARYYQNAERQNKEDVP